VSFLALDTGFALMKGHSPAVATHAPLRREIGARVRASHRPLKATPKMAQKSIDRCVFYRIKSLNLDPLNSLHTLKTHLTTRAVLTVCGLVDLARLSLGLDRIAYFSQ
jgi:hypothetical protein